MSDEESTGVVESSKRVGERFARLERLYEESMAESRVFRKEMMKIIPRMDKNIGLLN